MPISLQLTEAFNLEGFSLTKRNRKRYETTHSLADAVIVTNTANKYVDKILNSGFISCSRS